MIGAMADDAGPDDPLASGQQLQAADENGPLPVSNSGSNNGSNSDGDLGQEQGSGGAPGVFDPVSPQSKFTHTH